MLKTLDIAARLTVVTLLLTGLAYPLAMTGLAQVLFPHRANGSLQAFRGAGYFQPRPSAAGDGYDAANSSGSNLGPTAAKLRDRVTADVQRLHSENPDSAGPIPSELVTASARPPQGSCAR